PALLENKNLLAIGEFQNSILIAQYKALKVNITSEVLVAPYFNNNGKAIDITTTPSPDAYGYDAGITNGGLYSAQLNITKNLFNQSSINNVLLQNRISSNAIDLSSQEIGHNIIKNIADTYILAYQLQLQREFTQGVLADMQKRLQVVEILVKRAVLVESDYLLLELDVDAKKLELSQIETNFKATVNQLYTLSGIPIPDNPPEKLAEPNFETVTNPQKHFYERKFRNDSLQIEAAQRVFEIQYKPQLAAYANTGFNATDTRYIDHNLGASAGLRLTIPLYDGSQRKYNALQSELKYENLQHYKENAQIQQKNNLKSIEQQQTALAQNREMLKSQIKKQKTVLEIYKGKLVQGQISIIDYLNVIQNYKTNVYTNLQMQTNLWLLQSQYNFINW
ncbi:MAG: TolC family protein, partial [Leeuwenhoekiella sp.]